MTSGARYAGAGLTEGTCGAAACSTADGGITPKFNAGFVLGTSVASGTTSGSCGITTGGATTTGSNRWAGGVVATGAAAGVDDVGTAIGITGAAAGMIVGIGGTTEAVDVDLGLADGSTVGIAAWVG